VTGGGRIGDVGPDGLDAGRQVRDTEVRDRSHTKTASDELAHDGATNRPETNDGV
jgi:hypothetical protein